MMSNIFIKDNDVDVLITGENTFITKDNFQKLFGNTYDYQSLISHGNATDMWKERFEYLRETGVI